MVRSFTFFLIVLALAWVFKDGENPIYKFASRYVKVDSDTLKQLESKQTPGIVISVCSWESNYDRACAPVNPGAGDQQHPVYLWGAPGAKNPRTETAEACLKACGQKGPGFCEWRENGPEFLGGTTCSFVSGEICSHSTISNRPASDFLPSQVKDIKSGRCM